MGEMILNYHFVSKRNSSSTKWELSNRFNRSSRIILNGHLALHQQPPLLVRNRSFTTRIFAWTRCMIKICWVMKLRMNLLLLPSFHTWVRPWLLLQLVFFTLFLWCSLHHASVCKNVWSFKESSCDQSFLFPLGVLLLDNKKKLEANIFNLNSCCLTTVPVTGVFLHKIYDDDDDDDDGTEE